MSAFGAHVDDNQQFSVGGVVGTLGTADTGGTAQVIPIGVNPATGAMYVQDLSGASGTTTVQMVSGTLNVGTVVVSSSSGGTTVNIATGTQQTLGTVGVLNSGTINSATIVNANLTKLGSAIFAEDAALTTPQLVIAGAREDGSGGARALLIHENSGGLFVTGDTDAGASDVGFPAKIGGKAGTAEPTAVLDAQRVNAYFDQFGYQYVKVGAGTSNVILNSGTVTTGSLSNVAMVNAGTFVQASGTTTLLSTVTTLSNLTNGSINILTGTLQSSGTTTGVGVVSNVTNGSINVLTGTIQSSGTTTGVGVVSNLTNGSVNILTGTIQSAGTTTGVGVVSVLSLGTVKLNNTPAGSAVLTSHTLGTAGAAAFWGTLLAPVGAGTFAYLTGFSVVVHSGTPEVAITNNVAGSTGAGVITRGVFPPGGGIARDLNPVYSTVANGTIAYLINAGTASFNLTYWVSP